MNNGEKIRQLEIIQEPIITERSMSLIEKSNSYTFKVSKDAKKPEIRLAVEQLFKVNVLKVRTINVKPRRKTVGRYSGFTKAYKKAIVTIQDGQKIEAFDI